MREPCSETVINWPAISLSILLRAEAPANNEVMNSRSDLTIDQLFTIVSASALNDTPGRSHLRQGALGNPGGHSSCQQQAPHPLLVAQSRAMTACILYLLLPLPTSPPGKTHSLPWASRTCLIASPHSSAQAAVSPDQGSPPTLPHSTTFHHVSSSQEVLLNIYPPTGSVL